MQNTTSLPFGFAPNGVALASGKVAELDKSFEHVNEILDGFPYKMRVYPFAFCTLHFAFSIFHFLSFIFYPFVQFPSTNRHPPLGFSF